MAVNRFSPGCECCDTGCTRLSDNATSGSISGLWNNTESAFAADSDGYYNTTTSGTLMSNRPMATTDKKGSLKFYFVKLEVGATLKILFDYVDSNNHHYLTVSRTADTDCTFVNPAGGNTTGVSSVSLESNYDFVIAKVDSGVESSIASRTGVRGLEPNDERLCVEWDASHVIVHTTLVVDPVWPDESGYWNCEPSGFGLTTEYTTFDGADYGFSHDESSENQIQIKIIHATKSRVEANCPGCYLDCPCNVVPEEFDITVTGIANPELRHVECSNCSNLNDTYTLTLQADNYVKFPFGIEEWSKRTTFNPGEWPPPNVQRWINGMPNSSGNCVYAYSSSGHSSPPQATCDPGGAVYIDKMFLWFTDGIAHLQICLHSSNPMWTYDDDFIWPTTTPAYPLCENGAGAVFTFDLSAVSGTQYYDCFISESNVCPDTLHWWGEGRPQTDFECGSYNSGRTCDLSKMKISVVGS